MIGAVLICISSYQLFLSIGPGTSGHQILGTLAGTKSVVKTKNALALDWRDAFIGNEIAENQLIYTDQNSEAQIKFHLGDELFVGESSLVKIKTKDDFRGINVERGFIRAKLDGKEPLLVEMNGEEYRLSGSKADVQINLSGETGEIGVLSGKVKVEKDGLLENLDSSSALEIKGQEASKKAIFYQLIQPARGQRIHTAHSTKEVIFSWAPDDQARVLLSTSAKFQNPDVTEGQGSVSLKLSPGTYYWKVESRLGDSLTGQFTIFPEVKPKIIRPKDQEQVVLRKEQTDSELLLQWEGDSQQKFLVEWEDKAIHREIVQGPSALIKVLENGAIKWRVKIENLNRPEALWSDWQNIQTTLIITPDIPTELFPNEVEFQSYEKPNELVEMKWNASSAVEWELITPLGKKEFKFIKTSSQEYQASEAGEYRWRVRGVDNFSRTSDWSDWKTFSIVDLSQEEAQKGFQRIQLKRPDQQVEFNWKADEGAVSIFELSRDENFTDIISKQEVKSDKTKLSIPVVGTYYWRSRQFNQDGTVNVSEPKKVIIEPAPQIIKPEKLPDVEVPIEWKLPEDKSSSVWDWIIPSAHADEMTGKTQIQFPPNENASSYLIRIYKDSALSELLVEKELATPQFQWDDVKPGVYYWQYAIIDHWKRKSEFSDPSTLKVLAVQIPQTEKPILLIPTGGRSFDKVDLFTWTASRKNTGYEFQLAQDSGFQKIIKSLKTTKGEYLDSNLSLAPGEYFWRVEASNKWKQKSLSNTAKFAIDGVRKLDQEPEEKPEVKVDKKLAPLTEKIFKHRLTFAYAPSMDNYTFTKGTQKGDIDGQVLNGMSLNGTYFLSQAIFNAEVLRQSGKVFGGQDYLFQRLLVDAVYTKNFSSTHRLGLGPALGYTSGQEYDIQNGKVKATALSSFNYGASLRDYVIFNKNWELQSSLHYLLGDIKQMGISSEAIRHFESFYVLGGLGFSSREYKLNEGKQTSLRITLGLGKEF